MEHNAQNPLHRKEYNTFYKGGYCHWTKKGGEERVNLEHEIESKDTAKNMFQVFMLFASSKGDKTTK